MHDEPREPARSQGAAARTLTPLPEPTRPGGGPAPR